ncbi:hypothetical protein QTP88_016924 [Uroleucon formosanum]
MLHRRRSLLLPRCPGLPPPPPPRTNRFPVSCPESRRKGKNSGGRHVLQQDPVQRPAQGSQSESFNYKLACVFLLYVYTDTFLPPGIVVNELKDKKRIWERKDVAAEEDEEEEKTIHSLFVARLLASSTEPVIMMPSLRADLGQPCAVEGFRFPMDI